MDGSPSFGAWLRRRRKAQDITQAEMAARVGCVVGTIKSIEADARRPSRQLAARLADCLGLSPEKREAFVKAARGLVGVEQLPAPAVHGGLAGQPAPTVQVQPDHRHYGLPAALTPLIGREIELAELGAMLESPDCRLVTIIGPGGIGKTSLALAAASQQAAGFANGAAFIPLAASNSVAFVAPAILTSLGVPSDGQRDPREQLLDVLRANELLLVLDNVEQLLAPEEGAADELPALLRDILHAAPGVILLVTSRERLALPSEWLYDLGGLCYPNGEADEALEAYGAVRLFVQRARQVRRQFALTEGEARAVTRICRLVEGMPLAIELAAAGLRGRSTEASADAIEAGIASLATTLRAIPERHRSIVATFEHSWRLLGHEERQVLARLSVFRGGFEQAAAAEVAQAAPSLLMALLDKSLLRFDGISRYDMHELLRQYTGEKLREAGEVARIRNRHLAFYCGLAEQAEIQLYGPQQTSWLQRLDTDLDNLRAAMTWSLEQNIQAGLRLAGALHRYWDLWRPIQEGVRWLTQLIRHPDAAFAGVERAKALLALGGLHIGTNAFSEARSLAEEALAVYREEGDQHGVASALYLMGVAIAFREGNAAGLPILTECLSLARTLGDQVVIAGALTWMGYDANISYHDAVRARSNLEESLAICRALGDSSGVVQRLSALGQVAVHNRDFVTAHDRLHEARALHKRLRGTGDEAGIVSNLGELALRQGAYALAQAYFEESLSLNRASGRAQYDLWTLVNLGYAFLRQGDLGRAAALFTETQQRFRDSGDLIGVVYVLEGVAAMAMARGYAERSVRLFAWADAMREVLHDQRSPVEQDDVDRDLAAIRTKLDEATFAATWAAGQALTLQEAVAEALAAEAAPLTGNVQ